MMDIVVKTATYIGRRTTTKNTLAQFWIVDDKELGWKKGPVTYAQVGDMYEFSYDKDGRIVMQGACKPKKIGYEADREKVAGWVALDVAHFQHDVDRRAERRLKEMKTDFDKAMQPLQRMVSSIRHHDDRAAFIARVTATLWKTYNPF